MTRATMTSDDHRRKVMTLRAAMLPQLDARQIAMTRAVVETLRNPVVARAVARGLRVDILEKA